MSRQTTPTFISAFNASETEYALITLLTLTDQDDPGNPFYFCNNSVNVIGPGGQEYVAYPFDVSYPNHEEGKVSQASLTLTNVDRTIIDNLRQSDLPMEVQIDAVLSDDFTTPVATWTGYEWKGLSWDTISISGNLTLESYLNEPYPKKLMGGANFPGLFYGN